MKISLWSWVGYLNQFKDFDALCNKILQSSMRLSEWVIDWVLYPTVCWSPAQLCWYVNGNEWQRLCKYFICSLKCPTFILVLLVSTSEILCIVISVQKQKSLQHSELFGASTTEQLCVWKFCFFRGKLRWTTWKKSTQCFVVFQLSVFSKGEGGCCNWLPDKSCACPPNGVRFKVGNTLKEMKIGLKNKMEELQAVATVDFLHYSELQNFVAQKKKNSAENFQPVPCVQMKKNGLLKVIKREVWR